MMAKNHKDDQKHQKNFFKMENDSDENVNENNNEIAGVNDKEPQANEENEEEVDQNSIQSEQHENGAASCSVSHS